MVNVRLLVIAMADPCTGVPKSPAPSQQSTISTISTTSTRLTGTTGDSSGSSRNQSPMAEELSLEKLGLRVGDRIAIDASSSRPKVCIYM